MAEALADDVRRAPASSVRLGFAVAGLTASATGARQARGDVRAAAVLTTAHGGPGPSRVGGGGGPGTSTVHSATGEVGQGRRARSERNDGELTDRSPSFGGCASRPQSLSAHVVVGCAGLYADKVGAMMGADGAPKIVGFRGEYLQLKPEHVGLVRGLIYPVRRPC